MKKANDYFAWALNLCLVSNASGLFIDLVPEDGVIRALTDLEEMVLGQSLEKITKARLKGMGTVSRIQCGKQTTPEIFYLGVIHAIRVVEAWAQSERELEERQEAIANQSLQRATSVRTPSSTYSPAKTPLVALQSSAPPIIPWQFGAATTTTTTTAAANSNMGKGMEGEGSPSEQQQQLSRFAPHVLILQDIDQAPSRTLQCIIEMLHCRRLSVPPSAVASGAAATLGLVEPLQLPPHFLLIASSHRLPTATSSFCLNDCSVLPDRLLNGFLLRVPISFPSSAAAAAAAAAPGAPKPIAKPPPLSIHHSHASKLLNRADFTCLVEQVGKVYISAPLIKYVRMTCSKLGQHPQVLCGAAPKAADALLLAIRAQAAISKRAFAIPDDYYACVMEVLAHRIILEPLLLPPTSAISDHRETEGAEEGEMDVWWQARMLVATMVSSLQTLK